MPPKAKQRQRRLLRSLAWLVLTTTGARGWAQDVGGGLYREDPLWSLCVPQLKYIKTDVEAEQSSYKSSGGGNQSQNWVTVMPAVGIQWNNYIYHPYLLTYSLLFEPGYYWQQNGASGGNHQTDELMLNGSGTVNLLQAKPYATTVTMGRSHQEVQSDFFSSETVDFQNVGVLTGYRAGAVPVTLTYDQSQENRSGANQNFLTDQLKFGVRADNERKKLDTTVFDYQYAQYNNQSQSSGTSYSSDSSSHHLTLTDAEHFSQSTLASSVYFNERESLGVSSSDLNTALNYNVEHTPSLQSMYNYSMSDSFGDGYQAVQNSVLAGLSHQLYESLASHLDVHGSYVTSDSTSLSGNSSQNSTTCGTTASVDYSKRLGDWAHLTVDNSAAYDVTDQQTSGSEQVIPDESHTIPAVGPMIIRLNTPQDIVITSVTKNNVALDSNEWTPITTSQPWQIQFFSGGAHSVVNGDVILVTYIVQPNPSGSYTIFNYSGQIGLRFWNDQAGVRLGYLTTQNQADSPAFVFQNTEEYQVGADVGWRGLHADANYSDQKTTLYSYQNLSLSEGYSRPLSPHSTIGVNFNQQWSIFPPGNGGASTNQTQNLAFYSYMLHYDWHPMGSFSLNTEAGLQQQRGSFNDQDLVAARIYMNWMIGKLQLHFGYQHEYRQYPSETYSQDYVFLRMRRDF